MPGIGDRGPYDRFYLRNPGFNNHDLSVFKNFPLGGSGQRMLQLRLEMFNVLNHTQFSGVNRTTNVTNGAGQTGRGDLQRLHGPRDHQQHCGPRATRARSGPFFGEYNATRDPRIIQLGVKLYF